MGDTLILLPTLSGVVLALTCRSRAFSDQSLLVREMAACSGLVQQVRVFNW